MTNANDPIHFFASDALGATIHDGLTKREHFAGLAMASLAGSEPGRKAEFIVKQAVDIADALIAELNKEVKR